MTEKEKYSETSLCISCILAKRMEPHRDAGIVKECMLDAWGYKGYVDNILCISLSASKDTRNIQVVAVENDKTLK